MNKINPNVFGRIFGVIAESPTRDNDINEMIDAVALTLDRIERMEKTAQIMLRETGKMQYEILLNDLEKLREPLSKSYAKIGEIR